MSSGESWSRSFGGASVSAMQVYDELLVPRVFERWATLLMDTLEVGAGEALIDIACGPGSVARVAAQRVGPNGRVTACDLSPAMLELARAKEGLAGSAEITYIEAPADRLPVPDRAFDVVTCQQGLQFFPDRPAAVAEMLRALRPGGRAGIAVWTEIEHSPTWSALADAIEQVAGQELAERYRGGPWGFPDTAQLGALFEDGGFTDVRVSTHQQPMRFEMGPAQFAATLAASGIAAEIGQLPPQQADQIVETFTRSLGDGPIDSQMESNIVIARG